MEISTRSIFIAIFLIWHLQSCLALREDLPLPSFGPLVTKESRRTLVSTDSGSITAVDVQDRCGGRYHLQFITLDTSTLLLPVILHTDMVFYVHSGRGAVNWVGEDSSNSIEVRRGDIYRLEEGSVFYVHSHPDPSREKLRIYAIFNNILDENPSEGFSGAAYSNIADLVRGFNDEVLQMAFGVSEEDVRAIKWVERPPPIVHYEPKNETDEVDWREGIFEALIRGGRHPIRIANDKKKKGKTKTLNLVDRKPDVENCNGCSVAVTGKDFKPLKGSNIGMLMVNLTRGSMMGPHWNPKATEIAIVTHGQGIVQVVCPSKPSGVSGEDVRCQNMKFKVNEGDVFIVQQYHPMVQISYNNDSFVFVGFTTMAGQNHPQFLAGKRSALRTVDREILARSFNAANTTVDHLLDSQIESVMFECATCAEDLERRIEEEIERKREEEARKREEEAARRREEERKKEEEEEARKREEEEEEARKRKEEEQRRREEEEEDRKKREEEEEATKREEEEEEARKREEEEQRRREEEEEARRREEEEEARQREEEEAKKRAEEKQRREEEEEQRREEEEKAGRREEEEQRREEEQGRREEERGGEGKEAAAAAKTKEEARRQEEGEEARREEETAREQGEAAAGKWEEEMARRREEEQKKQMQAEEDQEQARREHEKQAIRKGVVKEGKGVEKRIWMMQRG